MSDKFTRYLDIDSTYRNRNEWPLVGNFEVEVAQSNNIFDPVSESAPEVSFLLGEFDPSVIPTTGFGSLVGPAGTAIVAIAPAGTDLLSGVSADKQILITTTANRVQTIDNYYAGAVIQATATSARVRIKTSTYLGLTSTSLQRTLLTSDSSFPQADFAPGVAITIRDPSDEYTTSPSQFTWIFIPNGSNEDNAYVDRIIYLNNLENGGQSLPIISYDGTTHLAKVEGNYTIAGATKYITVNIIKREVNLPNNTTDGVGYTSTNGVVSVNAVVPTDTEVDPSIGQSIFTFNVGVGASTTNNLYKNSFIRFMEYTTANYGSMYRILKYNGTTRIATLSGTPTNIADGVNIIEFTRENSHILTSTNTVRSQGKYQIELINLTIPNKVIVSANGGRPPFTPYLYVELKNVGMMSNLNVIYSNNPNTTRMLFRAPIDDVQLDSTSAFLKIDGDGTIQTINFDPARTVELAVTLPDGTIFQTTDIDTVTPSIPNPNLQISALFSITRVD